MIKGIFLFFSLLLYSIGYTQVFTVDNCYILSKDGVKKSPKKFNKTAFDAFVLKVKPPIEIYEQKLEGHVFINLFIKNNKIAQTSLMYGSNVLLDSELVRYFKKASVEWIGKETYDSMQQVVIGIKINYRYCSLENVSNTNLATFSSSNDINRAAVEKFKASYNKFDALYFFDSTNYKLYRKGYPKGKTKKIEKELIKLSWFKPEYNDKIILLDYDKNKIPNVIIQQNDSVYIVEDNKLLFNEPGHLRYIRRKGKDITLELETECSVCNKFNKTLWFYHQNESTGGAPNTITSYSKFPQLFDTISFIKTVVTNPGITYLRSNPFKINEPYNKCTGVISEENSCIVSKTWGNIFGEIAAGTKLNVLQEYTDLYKKKWYFVLANRVDGFFLGWINESNTKDSVDK
jgi:hypothetical protein